MCVGVGVLGGGVGGVWPSVLESVISYQTYLMLHEIEGSVCQYVIYLDPFTVESEQEDGGARGRISSCVWSAALIWRWLLMWTTSTVHGRRRGLQP